MSTDFTSIDDIPFQTLADEAPRIRERLGRFRRSLSRYFVGRERVVDLMTVAAVAQEPLLLVGDPGTAKSELVTKFREALGVPDTDYFEYMLTRFTEPSEILGPIDVALLREGRYVRRDRGKLPTATVVFLDEVFRSSSAILNALLTVINERKFYQDGVATPVHLKVLFAATNEVPAQAELAALKDRFCLKVACRSVQERHFVDLVDAGLDAQTQRELGQRPWAEGHATLADLLKAHRYMNLLFARTVETANGAERDRDRFFPEPLLGELRRLVRTLVREDDVFVSDRKVVKLYRLIRTHAWLTHGGAVEKSDLCLLSYVGDTRSEIDLLEVKVPRLLGLEPE
ncbi:MAG: AAA domain-containing protein [Polyangiaceae bacterium]|nr:AAA domain-containing protein [Polyangiaceae bacterium]